LLIIDMPLILVYNKLNPNYDRLSYKNDEID
jgi:hypothetical protein